MVFEELLTKAGKAKAASAAIEKLSTKEKNKILLNIADAVERNAEKIIIANNRDVKKAKEKNISEAFIERLTLTKKRISDMARGLREVAVLSDPVGEVIEHITRPNGLSIKKVRVPLGVIGIIYESRPNVTCDAAGLCFKAGNAVLLRGGSEAIESNRSIMEVMIEAGIKAGLPEGSFGLIETTDREAVKELIRMDKFIDVIIPRGGEEMINSIKEGATVPIISHGKGLCHTFIDRHADVGMAVEVCFNAKVQRPSVCNAMETLLVHKEIAAKFIPKMIKKYKKAGVEVRGCKNTKSLAPAIKLAIDKDWDTEYLSLIISIKMVDGLNEAIAHINQHGSKHSEAIISSYENRAQKFLAEVDAACVYWNASTRFTDGGAFGMGAEIGISTQKLHARGPMGLKELTSYKFLIFGNGQIRE